MNSATVSDHDDRVDVVVIGAGPAGAIAAAELAKDGISVVCLEQGGWLNASDFPGERPEWELLAQRSWHANPNVRARPEDYPCETSESEVNPLMFSGVGGTSIIYGGNWIRQLPSDFCVRSLDGVADDWPFSYSDLLPYYEAIDREIGAAGLGGDTAYPVSAPPPLAAHPLNPMGRKVAQGMNDLGWHWWPATNAMVTQDYRNLKRCARRGTCLTGCPEGAKASFDLTHWPTALSHGARVVTGARVREITTSDAGLATGAIYIDRNGVEHHQPADVVILAANSVGTPRLLFLSDSTRHPGGLANSSGLVGKRLMMHPFASVTGVFEDDLQSWLGPMGFIQSMEFYETDSSRDFVRGAKWGLNPTGGPLGAALSPFFAEETVTDEAFHENVRQRLGHSALWGIIAEDLPVESNCVTLDSELADSDGVPAPKIHYRSDANSERLLAFHVDRARESLEAAGAFETTVDSMVHDSGWHLLGTTTMGNSPDTSVVDQFGRTHDVPNLFLYGGSIFPTSSGVNPTATICAVTKRCVEHLISNRSTQRTPA